MTYLNVEDRRNVFFAKTQAKCSQEKAMLSDKYHIDRAAMRTTQVGTDEYSKALREKTSERRNLGTN